MIQKIKTFALLAMISMSSLPMMGQDLLAHQAPVDRRMKAVDSVALQRLIDFDNLENPSADLYEDWDNMHAHSHVTVLPDSFRISLKNFCMPTTSRVLTSNFGARWGRQHKGLDIKVYIGDTIRAAFAGKVRVVRYEGRGYGKYVVIRHDNGLETVYGHLTRFLVQPNQYVKAGQPIALSGNTGRSTGPHLHFETRFMGYAINPAAIIDFANRTTHTDSYTFNKNNYTESRSYTPSRKYAAVRSTSSSSNNNSTASKSNRKYDNKTKKRSAERSTYKVRKGDSLGKIAARNGTTVAQLKKLNGIKGDKVQSGKVLRVK